MPTENEDEDFENVVGILSKLVKPPGFPCPFPSYKVPRLPIVSARLHDDGFDFSRWCSWAHTSKRTQFTGTLLLLFWSGIEATDPNLAGLGSFVPQTPRASNFKDSSKPQLITSSETPKSAGWSQSVSHPLQADGCGGS